MSNDKAFSYRDLFHGRRMPTKEFLLALAGSVFVHTATLVPLFGEYAKLCTSPKKQQSSIVEDIVNKTTCSSHSAYEQIIPTEQEFIAELVADLEDESLNSMTFGEFMVTAEVYVHNSETRCGERIWDLQDELTWYRRYENVVLDEIVAADDPALITDEIFQFLHHGYSPYRPDDQEAVAFVERHGEFVRRLLKKEDTRQARPLVARKTGRYDCKSGTQWLTAIASQHPAIGDDLQVMVYDNHVLSVLTVDSEQGFYENTNPQGSFAEPEQIGVVRPKELFVVEYLLARDVSRNALPKKFQAWYTEVRVAAPGLINPQTNTFGIEAKVGIRSNSRVSELQAVPSRYPAPNCNTGICMVEFDDEKYDWDAILETIDRDVLGFSYGNYIQDDWQNTVDQCIFAARQVVWNDPEEARILQKYNQTGTVGPNGSAQYMLYVCTMAREFSLEGIYRLLVLDPQSLDEFEKEEGYRFEEIVLTASGFPEPNPYEEALFRYEYYSNFTPEQVGELLAIRDNKWHEDRRVQTVGRDITQNYREFHKQEHAQEAIDVYVARGWERTEREPRFTRDSTYEQLFWLGLYDETILADVMRRTKQDPDVQFVHPTVATNIAFALDTVATFASVRDDAYGILEAQMNREREDTGDRKKDTMRIFCTAYPSASDQAKVWTASLFTQYCPVSR